MLSESLDYKKETVQQYYDLLTVVEGDIPLEEMVRGLIASETAHVEEFKKMIRLSKEK